MLAESLSKINFKKTEYQKLVFYILQLQRLLRIIEVDYNSFKSSINSKLISIKSTDIEKESKFRVLSNYLKSPIIRDDMKFKKNSIIEFYIGFKSSMEAIDCGEKFSLLYQHITCVKKHYAILVDHICDIIDYLYNKLNDKDKKIVNIQVVSNF